MGIKVWGSSHETSFDAIFRALKILWENLFIPHVMWHSIWWEFVGRKMLMSRKQYEYDIPCFSNGIALATFYNAIRNSWEKLCIKYKFSNVRKSVAPVLFQFPILWEIYG